MILIDKVAILVGVTVILIGKAVVFIANAEGAVGFASIVFGIIAIEKIIAHIMANVCRNVVLILVQKNVFRKDSALVSEIKKLQRKLC